MDCNIDKYQRVKDFFKKQWKKISIGAIGAFVLMSIPLGYQIYKDWQASQLRLSVVIRPLYENNISLCVDLDKVNTETVINNKCRLGHFASIFIPVKIELHNLGSKPVMIKKIVFSETICNKQVGQAAVLRILDQIPDFNKTNSAEICIKSSYPDPNIYPIVIPQNYSKTFFSILWLQISAAQYEGIKFLFDLKEQGKRGCFVQEKLNLLKLSYFINMLYHIPCPECQFDLYPLLTLTYVYGFEMQDDNSAVAYVVPIMGLNRLLSYIKTKIDPLSYMDKTSWDKYMNFLEPCKSVGECGAMREIYKKIGKLLDVSEQLDESVESVLKKKSKNMK